MERPLSDPPILNSENQFFWVARERLPRKLLDAQTVRGAQGGCATAGAAHADGLRDFGRGSRDGERAPEPFVIFERLDR